MINVIICSPFHHLNVAERIFIVVKSTFFLDRVDDQKNVNDAL